MIFNKFSQKAIFLGAFLFSTSSFALQLDWSGQFWFDHNWLYNYQLDRGRLGYDDDPQFNMNGSPYVPGGGDKTASWYTAFLKLKPRILVNDSIQLKSEFQVGSPIYAFMGRGYPTTGDESNNLTGSQKVNMSVGAQRFWANIITDFGTIEAGRAPNHWGLGAIWNSGDKLFDRYQSSADMIRLTSKFGNFYLSPALMKIAVGNNLSGALSTSGTVTSGDDDITDLVLATKYDNREEDFEFGLNWTHRSGNAAQKSLYSNGYTAGSTRLRFNIFDFYAKKKVGRYSFGGEIPLISGEIGAADGLIEHDYKTVGVILESDYTSDVWDIALKGGHVPGQPNSASGDTKFQALYLNKNYGLGLIMFRYNLWGLTANNPDTIVSPASPFDAGIVNAKYVSLSPAAKVDKWTFKLTFVTGWANQAAEKNRRFWNYHERKYYTAVRDQKSGLGWELDLGIQFNWDENFVLAWDGGIWVPGRYYEFTNDAGVEHFNLDSMLASQIRVGITF
ncbi:MAG: hypothetical protein AB7F43_03585 [Bacteriovoracia bacterium]